jgi:hypothetical protein
MFQAVRFAALSLFLPAVAATAAQNNYQVVSRSSSGTITGTVKWQDPLTHAYRFLLSITINKKEICHPEAHTTWSRSGSNTTVDDNICLNTIVIATVLTPDA